MRALPAEAVTALNQRAFTLRDLVWIVAREFSDGSDVPYGMWSDVETRPLAVKNPLTGTTANRSFEGAGGLVSISPIRMTSDMTVQAVTVDLSPLTDANQIVRGYDMRQARIEIFRGHFSPSLRQLFPAECVFLGFVDEVEILTPREGEQASITLTCVSHSQEMSRINPATRSDADTRQRSATDSFRKHAATVGTWESYWGA